MWCVRILPAVEVSMSEAIEQPQVVFGASGGVGSALVRELLSWGRRVRAVSHSGRGSFPKEAEVVRADATDTATVREVSRGAAVVYHTVNVPYLHWQEKLPLVMSAIIEVAADAGAKLIYADNLYMYGMVDGPMTEETPLGEVWHTPSPQPVTGREFIELVFDEARRPPKFGTYTRTMIFVGGLFSSQVREFREMLYQFEAPFVLDSSKYTRVFGDVEPTLYREGIARTVRWLLSGRRDG
jgi:nucleoside-diphosphate-sugar epimerase